MYSVMLNISSIFLLKASIYYCYILNTKLYMNSYEVYTMVIGLTYFRLISQ